MNEVLAVFGQNQSQAAREGEDSEVGRAGEQINPEPIDKQSVATSVLTFGIEKKYSYSILFNSNRAKGRNSCSTANSRGE